jgi:carbamoyl-phosphate synthase large subunit
MDPIRVLVTGAGSGVGQGIIKALHIAKLPLVIIGGDIQPMHAAFFRTDEAMIIPKVEEKNALEIFCGLIKKQRIDVLMVGSEFELEFFAEHKGDIEAGTNCLIVASPLETVRMANDKWLTAEFLRKAGLPYPESFLARNAEEAKAECGRWGYPVLIKPRRGTSSRHVHIVHDAVELSYLYPRVPAPMIQRLLGTPSKELDNEYTCSVFKCRGGNILGPFTARRTLRGGDSWIVEVKQFEVVASLLKRIAKNLPMMGTLNVQLMMGDRGPIPFEFNARFSGTTHIRAHFGFNEPEFTIRDYYLKESLEKPKIQAGLALRYNEEVFLDKVSRDHVKEPFPKGRIRQWF